MSKNVGMTIRLDEDLRAEFIAQCKREAIPASVVLREFIKGFVSKKPNETTLNALKEFEQGKVTRHTTMDSFIHSLEQ